MKTEDIFPITGSNLFQEWQLEKKEIEKIRWTESEKEGFDIGQDRAEFIWISRYRFLWRKNRIMILRYDQQ